MFVLFFFIILIVYLKSFAAQLLEKPSLHADMFKLWSICGTRCLAVLREDWEVDQSTAFGRGSGWRQSGGLARGCGGLSG